MGRVRSFQFGPGSLESVELRMWLVPRSGRDGLTRLIKTRATGSYRVYCGAGREHSTDVDEWHVFDVERPDEEVEERLAVAWTGGDRDAAWDAAHQLVDWALEGWTDPCEACDEW